MKFITTWCFEPYLKGTVDEQRTFSEEKYMWACARGSIESFTTFHKNNVTIYTDSIGAEIFPMLSDKVDCINLYDDIHAKNNVPLYHHTFAKHITYWTQTDPFLHFDLDLILQKPIPSDFFDSRISFEYEQRPNRSDILKKYYTLSRFPELNLPEIFCRKNLEEIMSPNLGVFWMNDMDLHSAYCKILKWWYDPEFRDVLSYRNKHGERITVCDTEQQGLGLLIHDARIPYKTMSGNYHIHYQGTTLKKVFQSTLDKWVDDSVLSVAERVEKLRGEY